MSGERRNITVPLVAYRRFTALRDQYAADLHLPALSGTDLFVAFLKHAEQDPAQLCEIVRRMPKNSQA